MKNPSHQTNEAVERERERESNPLIALNKNKSFLKLIVIALLTFNFITLQTFNSSAQNIGINTTGAAPNAKALLDIDAAGSSPKGGLLVPRLTTAERNAITAPIPMSLLIFNTTTECFEAWNQTSSIWVAFGCIGCQLPGAFTANAASGITATAFDANWAASASATTYYLDVATDAAFTSFVSGYNNLNVGNVLTSNVTGLTCATTYYYRIRASNTCGTSTNPNVITLASSACPPGSCGTQFFAATNLNAGTQISEAITQTNNATAEKWCYNDVAANCVTYGGLYQWNEAMNYAASTNCDPCGAGGVQGQCPAGYHIPTDLEWSRYEYCIENNIAPTGTTSLVTFQTVGGGWRGSTTPGVGPGDKMKAISSNTPAWDGTNTSGFNALPTGYSGGSGSSIAMGTFSYFWTATEDAAPNAWIHGLYTGNVQSLRGFSDKIYARPIRCLQN